MDHKINRREFLKLIPAAVAGVIGYKVVESIPEAISLQSGKGRMHLDRDVEAGNFIYLPSGQAFVVLEDSVNCVAEVALVDII